MLKSIDLFAGIGGIRLGFEQAFGEELKTVFVSEWDEYAQKTYRANFLMTSILQEILRKFPRTLFRTSTFALPVFLAKRSVLRGSAKVLRTITKVCRAVRCFST